MIFSVFPSYFIAILASVLMLFASSESFAQSRPQSRPQSNKRTNIKSNAFAIKKDYKSPLLVPAIPKAVDRVFTAHLWYEKPKAPAGTGTLILLNSSYALLKLNSEMSKSHYLNQIVILFNAKNSSGLQKGHIVDFEVNTDWFLVDISKNENKMFVDSLMEAEALKLVTDNQLLGEMTIGEFKEIYNKFTNSFNLRNVAAMKTFPRVAAENLRRSADNIVTAILNSSKKMWWSEKVSVPVPVLDNCFMDIDLKRHLKKSKELSLEDAYICHSTKQFRSPAQSFGPQYSMAVGVLRTTDTFLNTTNATSQLNKLNDAITSMRYTDMENEKSCVSYWIKPKNIWAKSCVNKNSLFGEEYDAVHTFGFYKNRKLYYQVISLNGFSSQNHQDIVNYFMSDLRGSVL